ncbi:hypothetical protein B0T24DRAFT_60837 [Lasiosphaeria ovina]|uniref:t-SNARE coiled-coil homology domain-containing protein n=1 Tax=Lasiosphaeria ovina TaxID=92902 RepID=A0AAE0TY47_9PEZI|nr:hypothetical protein B0T24DRAFT_60837 [Lasiosphaeria ovina]
MGRFGFGKKSDDKKSKDGGSQDSNPYAVQPAADPYANSYAAAPPVQGRQGLPSGPRVGLPTGPRPGLPRGPAPSASSFGGQSTSSYGTAGSSNYGAPPPAYTDAFADSPQLGSEGSQYGSGSPQLSTGSPQVGSGSPQPGGYGYAKNKLGAPGGYGGGRFDNNVPRPAISPLPQRNGGYGGLGDPSAELFGDRYNNRPPPPPANAGYDPAADSTPSYDASDDPLTGYGDRRELTEDEQADFKKTEINKIRGQSKTSIQNSIRMATEMDDRMNQIMGTVDEDGERLLRTRVAMDQAETNNNIAGLNVKDLDKLTRTPFFAPSGASDKRTKASTGKLLANGERRREDILRQANEQDPELVEYTRQLNAAPRRLGAASNKKAERKKFTFEDDTGEQEADEEFIDDGLDVLDVLVKRQNLNSKILKKKVEMQNDQIDYLNNHTDKVHDGVRKNYNIIKHISDKN